MDWRSSNDFLRGSAVKHNFFILLFQTGTFGSSTSLRRSQPDESQLPRRTRRNERQTEGRT
jgi:hypothetical protein